MIKTLSEAKSTALDSNMFSQIPVNISFPMRKTSVVTQPHASRSKVSGIKSALQEWWHFLLKRASSGQQ